MLGKKALFTLCAVCDGKFDGKLNIHIIRLLAVRKYDKGSVFVKMHQKFIVTKGVF